MNDHVRDMTDEQTDGQNCDSNIDSVRVMRAIMTELANR